MADSADTFAALIDSLILRPPISSRRMRLRVPLLPWWVRWSAVAGLAAFIFYTSIVTAPPETVVDQLRPGPESLLPLDKWRHLLAYATLGYGLAYATTDWNVRTGRLAALVLVTTVLYGVGVEFGQSLIPGRFFSVGDAYANAFGAALVLPWYLLRSYVAFVPLRSWVDTLSGQR
jgi:VanZ family protein